MSFQNIRSFLLDICNSPIRRFVWLILFLFSLMGMVDIAPANIFKMVIPLWVKWTCISLSATLKASFFLIFAELCRGKKILEFLAKTLIVIYCFLCLVNFVNYELYEFGISHKMFMLISETNSNEIIEFLGSFANKLFEVFTLRIVCIIAIACILGFSIVKMKGIIFFYFSSILTFLGLLGLVFLVFSTFHGKNTFSILVRTCKTFIEVCKENREINDMQNKMQPYKNASIVESSQKAHNMIVVFGESADPSHMSLYGYGLTTTPVFDAMKDSLFVFKDALASSKFTSDNMERMLTMKKDSQSDSWWNYPILLDIFKAAGYETYWISNQERSGIFSNGTGVISSRADITKYIGKTSSEDPLLQKYDDALIKELRDALSEKEKPKWIGLHLYGSHVAYQNRYPENRQHFIPSDIKKVNNQEWMDDKHRQTVSYYDNSIRFTDSVVGKMIEIVSCGKDPSVLLYLSDHGENVFDDRNFNGRDIRHVHIPFVIYANEAYRKENPDIMEAIMKAIPLKITSANLPYTLMTLSGTVCPEYEASNDFLSNDYVEKDRYVEHAIWEY